MKNILFESHRTIFNNGLKLKSIVEIENGKIKKYINSNNFEAKSLLSPSLATDLG
jgi:hypothetical protein